MKDAGDLKDATHAIIQKINVDAQQHSDEYYEHRKNVAAEELNNETAGHITEINKRREMLLKNNEHEYDRMYERMVSRVNRELLTYQHNLTDEIFDMAVMKLRNVSEEEFSDMFKIAVSGLKGKFILYIGELSKYKLNADDISRIIKENDGIEIVLSGEFIPKKSGFVLRDDRVEYNCLFEDLIEDRKNEQAALILKEIFGDSESQLTL